MMKRAQNYIGYVLYKEKTLLMRRVWDLLRSRSLDSVLAESCLYSHSVPPVLAGEQTDAGLRPGDSEFARSHREFVYHLKKPTVIEPDFGYVIAKPFSVIDMSLPYSQFVRSRRTMEMFSGLPGFVKLSSRNTKRLPLRREACVISLRFPFEENYYHCFQDILSRLMLIDEVVGDRNIPVVVGRRLANTPYFRAISQRGTLAGRNWVVQDDCYIEAEEVIFAFNSQGNREWLDKLLDGMEAPEADPHVSRRIFLTRPPGGKQQGRFIRNAHEVHSLVRQYGFDQVDTSGMSLDEQMKTFSQAGSVIGIHGAGLTNILFRRGGKLALMEIFPPNCTPLHYCALAKAYGYSYDHLRGHSPSDGSGRASFALDTEQLEQKLRTHSESLAKC